MKTIERAVKNYALPTPERMARKEIVIKNGKMHSRHEFVLDKALERGTLSRPGEYCDQTRYWAAKRYSEMALKSMLTNGSMNFDTIASSSGYINTHDGKMNIIHEIACIQDSLPRVVGNLLWKVLVIGQTLKETMPSVYEKRRPDLLCSALDDLVNAIQKR